MSESAGQKKVSYRAPGESKKRRPDAPIDEFDDSTSSGSSKSRKKSSDSSTALLKTCEPLFQKICLYNHAMQNGAKLAFPQARREIEDLFERIRAAANEQAVTAGLYDERLHQSLMFFVDNFFADCGQTPIAQDWAQNRLAFALNPPNYVGDEQFFKNLDHTLHEKLDGVHQKLAVYFTCIGLGMTGVYGSQPQVLRKKQLEVAQKIRNLLESNAKRRICPDAYESINTDNLIEPPIKPPVLIGIALGLMVALLLLVYFVAYKSATADLVGHFDSIRQKAVQTTDAKNGNPTTGDSTK